MKERRVFSRVKFIAKVQIDVTGKIYNSDLIDISLKGLLVNIKNDLSFDSTDKCNIKLFLLSPNIILNFESQFIHKDESNYGFKFIRTDNNTIMHLRRLIELNCGNSDRISDELAFLINKNKV